MIEWLIVAALVGTGLLGTGKNKQSSAPSPNRTDDHPAQAAQWRADWEPMIDRGRWIPKSMAARIIAKFPSPRQSDFARRFGLADPVEAELLAEFATHNVAYLAAQKEKLKPFFEGVEKYPLTDDQMDGCICMDDAVQIVASAGSGKTSTMVARVGYALHEGLVKPEEILVLAFNRAVASELRTRIDDRPPPSGPGGLLVH